MKAVIFSIDFQKQKQDLVIFIKALLQVEERFCRFAFFDYLVAILNVNNSTYLKALTRNSKRFYPKW